MITVQVAKDPPCVDLILQCFSQLMRQSGYALHVFFGYPAPKRQIKSDRRDRNARVEDDLRCVYVAPDIVFGPIKPVSTAHDVELLDLLRKVGGYPNRPVNS